MPRPKKTAKQWSLSDLEDMLLYVNHAVRYLHISPIMAKKLMISEGKSRRMNEMARQKKEAL